MVNPDIEPSLNHPTTAPQDSLGELCAAMNALGQQLQLGLQMSRTDKRKNLVIILYSRSLTLFQEMQNLVETPKEIDKRTQALQLLDAAVATAAACRQRKLIEDFYGTADRQRIYRRKAYQALPRDIGGRISVLSGRYFAEIGGLSDYYQQMLQHMDPEQTPEPPPHQLSVVACECFFLAIRSVTDFFSIKELEKEYYQSWRQFITIAHA